MPLPDWPFAHGRPSQSATIRRSPDDFRVAEVLGFKCSGDGEHDFLYIEKTSTNTEWLSRQLGAFAGVSVKDVGYSGLKDRHAVTRQWFSVPRWNRPEWSMFELDNVTVLDVDRNNKKLRRGAHRSNRFHIILRDFSDKMGQSALSSTRPGRQGAETLSERLQKIQLQGVPNYFGEQRFGRNAGNVELADAWAAGKRLPRQKRSIAISTVRSFLFNEQLAARIRDGSWNTLLDGDVANLDGTNSVFDVDSVNDELQHRCSSMDIHPAAILCGDDTPSGLAPAGFEHWMGALQKARVKSSFRSMRLPVRDLEWRIDNCDLTLDFALIRGSFATAVLREFALVSNAH